MKRILTYYFTLFFLFILCSANQPNGESQTNMVNAKYGSNDQEIERKVEELLAKMTLEEKVGQMTQLTLDAISKGEFHDANKPMEIDEEKLKKAILQYHVGSILNTGAYTLSREKWYEIIGRIQEMATKDTRLKIPVIYGIDAIHGANYTVGATLFPQEIALAATWDPKFAEKGGEITAYEVRASAIPWNFSPVLDLARQPLWSRVFETFGEDPYLATQMGLAMVKGYQGENVNHPEKVAACLKHYVGYSYSFSGKDRTPIYMPEWMLREYFLAPFKAAIENGAQTVMINSAEINGVPVHANKYLLTDLLKEELKFDGFSVTDWEDIVMLHTVHKVAPTMKDAVKIGVNAGIDMSMVPYDFAFSEHLVELVKEGQVSMSRIDDAVRRILRVKFRLGLFEKPYYPMTDYPKFGSAEFAQANYEAALESVTLLKNEGNVLPLDKSKKYLLTGVGANSLNYLNGAWTHTWQGVDPQYNTKGKKTILDAVKDKVGAKNVKYVEGTTYDKDVNTSEAVKAARSVDAVIVVLGEIPSTEKVGDIEDLTMPEAQLNLVKEIAKTGKPIVLVLLESRPRIIRTIEPLAKGIINGYQPGDEGGRAIVEVLFGDYNPSGKLPITYPRYPNSLVLHDHKFSEKRDKHFGLNAYNPQWDFGFGLSYTTFAYSDLKLSSNTLKGDEKLSVSVKVTNTGKIAGKEVVQLYTRDEYASVTPNVKRLRRFQKIALNPGESKTVTFTIDKNDLAFVDMNNQWITEPGAFKVMISDLTADFEYIE
ncbi:MAG TPA: glycoside hydrolase family 3 N-terminal domain-containing protein [Cytophagaceae bacterium]